MKFHVLELGSRLMMDVRAGALVMPVFVYDPTSVQTQENFSDIRES